MAAEVSLNPQGWLRPFVHSRSLFPLLMAIALGIASLALPFAYPFTGAGYRVVAGAMATVLAVGLAGRTTWIARVIPSALGLRASSVRMPVMLLIALVVGYGYGHWRVSSVMAHRLPLCADAVTRHFQLTVLAEPVYRTLPARFSGDSGKERRVARFRAQVEVPPDPDCPGLDSHTVRLTWYDPPLLEPRSLWQVELIFQ